MKIKLLLLAMGISLSTQSLMAQVPNYIPTDGLVGYWPFNDNANDVSGNKNNGTVNGATKTTDRFGNADKAYSFNGINNSISVSNSKQLLNLSNFSYSTWVYTNINTPADGLVICSYDGNNRGALLYCNTNLSEIRITNNSNTNISAITKSNTLSMSWHHIVVVKSNNELKMYLDNLLMDTIDISNFNYLTSSIYPLTFGKASWYSGGYYNGKIDDIAIYNRALTQQEITTMYNSVEVPTYSDTCNNVSGSLTQGLVGYWPFCGNANDDSGNGNDGTVNGATLTTDRFGNANSAYNFDGVNNFITAPRIYQSSFSVSVWFNTNGNEVQVYNPLIDAFDANWEIQLKNSYPDYVSFMTDSNYQEFISSNLIQNNVWYNLVCTYSNNVVKFYINGILTNQFTVYDLPNNIGNYYFGASISGADQFYNGKLDDIGIWNRALSPTEVSQLFNQNQCFTNTTVTDTLIINVGQLSYTNPIAYSNNITIAPNPASSHININFNNITDLNGGTLKIINSLGQQVATTPITTSGTQSIMQLATWGGSGMYFVQIINPQGIVVDVKKIILQ